MPLLSVYANTQQYRIPSFDREQSRSVFGDNIADQFDVNFEAKSYRHSWSPLNVAYVKSSDHAAGDLYPDISEHNGRLVLNDRAYRALKELLSNDGEFLPVVADGQSAFIFNPLQIAEDVNGLNEKLRNL